LSAVNIASSSCWVCPIDTRNNICSNKKQQGVQSAGGQNIVWQLQILLVDDCKEWRQTLRSILEPIPYYRVIDEAGDALEGIEKAAQLHPDIVLLDIGMPFLNGIEATPRIHRASPNSKVIFVTQEAHRDVKTAALAAGGEEYLLKSRVASELIPAIDSLMLLAPPPVDRVARDSDETRVLPCD
jgi:DNA-binding NarL/FixJ family response regulator